MDGRQDQGGYGGFGSDFISFGSAGGGQFEPDSTNNTPWNRPGRRGLHQSYGNQYRRPYDRQRGGPRPRGRGRGGNQNFRGHQGPRHSGIESDISVYFHPSMLENPWHELETLYKGSSSNSEAASSSVQQCDVTNSKNSSEEDAEGSE